MSWQAPDVCRIVAGEFLTPVHTGAFGNLCTDTRSLAPGDWFVAIPGRKRDGHEFLREAVKRGAVGCLVSREFVPEEELDRIPVIRVKDTVSAIGDLARVHRGNLDCTVVAITGSNGKTTTKELTAHILAQGKPTLRSEKSFNNAIGLPLTVLRGRPEHAFAVLELGTSGPGEIAYLATIARPHVGVITNVSETHLAGLKTVEGVARAKAELLGALVPPGVAVLNQDNEMTRAMARRATRRTVTFGMYKEADIRGSEVETAGGALRFKVDRTVFELPVLGPWNVYNALAAIAVCTTLGLSLEEIAPRLAGFRLPPMRMERSVVRGVTLINDAYNANPRSVLLLLDEFEALPATGRKILVFGDMAELGAGAAGLHEKVGERIARIRFDALITVGTESRRVAEAVEQRCGRKVRVLSCGAAEEAGDALVTLARAGDLVLFKGSRESALERAVQRFSSPRELAPETVR